MSDQTPPPLPPAGWFPTGDGWQRYWDGARWTEHTAPIAPAPTVAAGSDVAVNDPRQGALEAAAVAIGAEATKPGFLARRRARREEVAEGQRGFTEIATAAATGDTEAMRALPAAVETAKQHYRGREWDKKRLEVVGAAVRHAIDDDVLDVQEEAHVVAVLQALEFDLDEMHRRDPQLYEELVVARINDGRPPVLENPAAVLKAGEVGYGQFQAALMKEVVRKEYRGGSSGVSVPIGFGMRYRTSSTRGRMVVVGTDLVAADTGVLVVTNSRALFIGGAKTLEFRYDRLVGLQQYNDGLRLSVSNRQTASLFRTSRCPEPGIAAALIAYGASRG